MGNDKQGIIKPINPLVSAVVVNWNTCGFLLRGLESLRLEAAQVALEIIVVDNASTDNSAGAVAENFPEVQLIRNAENLGFAAAVNQALARAKAPYWALINADVELLPGALSSLLKTLEDRPDVWVAGPQLLNADGSLQLSGRRFPTLTRFALETFLPGRWQRSAFWKKRIYGREDFTRPAEVPEISGACFLARRKAFDWVGKFDDRFFLYFEELDWFVRLAAAGGRVLYQPGSRVIHHWGASAKQVEPLSRIWYCRSCFFYWRKRGGRTAEVAARGIVLMQVLARIAGRTVLTLLFIKRGRDYRKAVSQELQLAAEVWRVKRRQHQI